MLLHFGIPTFLAVRVLRSKTQKQVVLQRRDVQMPRAQERSRAVFVTFLGHAKKSDAGGAVFTPRIQI